MRNVVLLLVLSFSPVSTFAIEKEPQQPVVKWCQDESGHVRYASAGITPVGYAPCGELRSSALCDPLGNKYYGRPQDAPYGYKDCALGQRIFLELNGKVIDVPALYKKQLADMARNYRENDREMQKDSATRSIVLPELLKQRKPGTGENSLESIMKMLEFSRDTFEFMAETLNSS